MHFEKILEKYSIPKRLEHPGLDPATIGHKFNLTLPEDYAYFLSRFYGFEAEIGPEYFALWEINELVDCNEMYEFQTYYPKGIGIGSNMGGELIVLENVDLNEFRVILIPAIGMDCPINIGDSFEDFLIRLDQNRKWFA